jgi:hypothetical protein
LTSKPRCSSSSFRRTLDRIVTERLDWMLELFVICDCIENDEKDDVDDVMLVTLDAGTTPDPRKRTKPDRLRGCSMRDD